MQEADAPVVEDEVSALPVQLADAPVVEEDVRALPVQEPLDPEQLPVTLPV